MSETRQEISHQDAVKLLLGKLRSERGRKLTPTYDPHHGCRYPDVEHLLGRSHEETIRFLDELTELGILDRKSVDKILACPECRSPNIWLRFLCPQCNSHEVVKKALMEHMKCGYMGGEDHYIQGPVLACPRCKTRLVKLGTDYRTVGAWFECASCKKRFSEPNVAVRCGKCDKISALNELGLDACYVYTLREEVAVEAVQFAVLQNLLTQALKEQGYRVETPGFVTGASGVQHRFDVVASSGAEPAKHLLIDIATAASPIGEQPILSVFAKASDAGPSHPFLLALPGLTDAARRLAAQYKIRTVEAESPQNAADALKAVLTHG